MQYNPTKIKNVKRLKNKDLSRILIRGVVMSKSKDRIQISDDTGTINCVVKDNRIPAMEILSKLNLNEKVEVFGQIWLFNGEDELYYELELFDIEILSNQ